VAGDPCDLDRHDIPDARNYQRYAKSWQNRLSILAADRDGSAILKLTHYRFGRLVGGKDKNISQEKKEEGLDVDGA
jgi:hypothetical protein